ncbi:hypothetical protein Tco_1470767 [Tanacetum coccineum]
MDTEDAQDAGRTINGVNAEKEGTEDGVSTEDVVSTDKEKVSTDKSKVSTDRLKVSKDRSKDSTDKEEEGTNKDKDSTVSLDEGTDDRTEARSATPTSLTTTPTMFPTTTPTMFGDAETIAQKFKQLARDEEMARKLQEDWETEEERKRLAEEEAIKTTLSDEYDFIQARIKADRLLALRLQDEERERESSSLSKKEQSSFMIQLQLKEDFLQNKELLQSETNLLQELMKRFDESFTVVGSTEDEKGIKEMNERVKDTDQERLKEEDTAKVHAKVEVIEQGTIDSEIMEKKSFISKLDKVSSPEGGYLVIHRANGNFKAFNYLMEVLHIFDR